MADIQQMIVQLDLKGNLTSGIQKAERQLSKFSGSVGRTGKGIGQIGAGLGRAGLLAGGALVTGLTVTAKAAIDWQEAFQGVVKTVDEVDLSKAGLTFRELELTLRKMATEMPNSAAELAGIAESAGALGIKAKDIEAFTRQVAILSSTTDVSAEDAATALGQLQNVIGLTGDEFDNFAASLVDLGNKGASTEAQILEIARRSGGAAKLIGIAKEETLGWASAAANLGLNEELAGTALQNMFLKLMPKYITGSKTLMDVTGKTAKELKKAFKDDAGGAIESLLTDLGKMPKDARLEAVQKLFGKGSGLTRLVLGLSDSIDKNLSPSLETSTDAWADATAAQVEFEKRNATVKSSISRLRNGIIDAAITVGEGFAPAVGEAASKLAMFLKSSDNRAALTTLGKDIGKAIEGIDWKQVLAGAKQFVGVLKEALSIAKVMWDGFNALPGQLKASIAALLVLNKASGGLVGAGVGNVVGGVAETAVRGLGSKLPGVGSLFAQPVFVTNMPLGGFGGGTPGVAGAASKGIGALGKMFLVGEAIGLVAAVLEVRNGISDANSEFARNISQTNADFIKSQPNPADLQNALNGVNQGITDLQSNPLLAIVQGDALTELRNMRKALQAQIVGSGGGVTPNDREDRNKPITPAISKLGTKFNSDIANLRKGLEAKGDKTITSVEAAKSAINASKDRLTAAAAETKRETSRGAMLTASASRLGASQTSLATMFGSARIVSAIYANRPILNVNATTVVQASTVKDRYGPSGGSRKRDAVGPNAGGR